ncbi:MAG: 16S rRNA (uracil(1498)-N(3))-methyltransferase [Clostridium sp.]|nr:16S rRNA (uracil(1498)-N(3))-methyltransferase [Clostridium sp.]
MPHFFITTNDINSDMITISDKENFHHIVKVLRAKVGEKLVLVDENQTQYTVFIKNIDNKSITTKVVDMSKSKHCLDLNLFLAQSVLKSDAQNMVIQKATELGVKGIIPFVSDNCVIKESVIDSKISKWQKIANEAVKQCERTDFPIITEKSMLEQLLRSDDFDIKIACVEREDNYSLKACLRRLKIDKIQKILVIIGPEGGFSARELKFLEKSCVYRVSLGKMILRAETAVIAALSNIIYELENE